MAGRLRKSATLPSLRGQRHVFRPVARQRRTARRLLARAAASLTRASCRRASNTACPTNRISTVPGRTAPAPIRPRRATRRRCSAAVGYLRPALARRNLKVMTGAPVSRIVVENGRAVGVEVIENGRPDLLRAEREVVVASGAIGSPKLMLLSGLGPADELRAVGVPVVADLPGVGRNLHDHFGIDMVYELSGPYSLDKYDKPHWKLWAGLEYALFRKGPVASNIVEGGAFWYGDRDAETPDLQFHFLVGAGVEEGVPKIPSGSGVTLNSYTLRPKARGFVKLRSANLPDKPIVDPGFLGDPYDLKISSEGIKISRDI